MTSQQPSTRLRPFRPLPFGRYTLLFPLSTGGMGEIYLARLEGAQGFEKLCVIKKILPHLSSDPEFVERFVNEAKTLVKLSHGSIAQVLDMGVEGGDPYLALEHVDGKDLRKVAARMRDRDQPVPLTFVLYVMSRLLDALAYAHRKRDDDEKEIGLVHRDVSPQNVLISYEGEVKVIDFGLAKSTLNAAKTNPSIILGKFLYMSPEQARHQKVDRRSDLYAVGLCLYEMIAGKNPFDEVPPGELMAMVANPAIVPLQEIEPLCPGSVSSVVMRALEVDPARRFQTAEEFRGKLLAGLLEIDPSAGPESVSRFMREAFSAEFTQERKLLASLREQIKAAATVTLSSTASPREKEVDTAVFALRDVAPSPEAAAALADAPVTPSGRNKSIGPIHPTALSFAPTPRATGAAGPSGPQFDGETMPGIVVDLDAHPGKAGSAPARSAARPGLAGPVLPPPPKSVAAVPSPRPSTPPSGAALPSPEVATPRGGLTPASGATGARAAITATALPIPAIASARPAGTTSGVHSRPGVHARPSRPAAAAMKASPPVPEPAVVVQAGFDWSPPTGASAQTPVGVEGVTGENPASTLDEPETDAVAPTFESPTFETALPALPAPPPGVVVGTLLESPEADETAAEAGEGEDLDATDSLEPLDPVESVPSRPVTDAEAEAAMDRAMLEALSQPAPPPRAKLARDDIPEPPELMITQNTGRRRSVWLMVLPVLLVTLAVAGYFVYDLYRSGVFSFGPEPAKQKGPPPPRGAKPRAGDDTAKNPNAARSDSVLEPGAGLIVQDLPEEPAGTEPRGGPAVPPANADAPSEVPSAAEPAKEASDDDIIQALNKTPPKKEAKKPAPKKAPRSPVTTAFNRAKAARDTLDRKMGCDSGGHIGLLCNRFNGLEAAFEDAQVKGGGHEDFVRQANRLHEEIQAQLKKGP